MSGCFLEYVSALYLRNTYFHIWLLMDLLVLKLPVGTIPAKTTDENPDDYSYLCADGSKMSVKEKPCAWAARPWQGMLAHQDLLDNVDPLRNKLRELGEIGNI